MQLKTGDDAALVYSSKHVLKFLTYENYVLIVIVMSFDRNFDDD